MSDDPIDVRPGTGETEHAAAIVVRVARPDEYATAGRIGVAAYAAVPGDTLPAAYAASLDDVAGRVALGAEVLVAVHRRAGVIGTVTLILDDGPLFEHEYGRDGDCSFRMLAVDPAAAGLGAGRALVEASLARFRAAGRRRCVIATTPFKETALGLYARMGFVRAPELDLEVFPGGERVVLLSLVLDLEPRRPTPRA
jgi:ribosomal protein S18 acetylase RimI-like enzyme